MFGIFMRSRPINQFLNEVHNITSLKLEAKYLSTTQLKLKKQF